MAWSYPPVIPELTHQPAWFPEPPEPEPTQHGPAWFPRWRFNTGDEGIGTDSALLVPEIAALDRGVGTDGAAVSLPGLLLGDQGVGTDLALPGVLGADRGVGSDLALPGVFGTGLGLGADSGLVRPLIVTGDQACGADVAVLLIPIGTVVDQGIGADTATAGFAPHAALAAAFTTAGAYTFTIPVWCRYIDVILLGGGGGGRGMINIGSWGEGGWGGNWAVYTLERGVHIPWTARTITGSVGAGGAGSASGFSPARGQTGGSSTAATDGWSGVATGGLGGQNALAPNGRAVSPLTQTVTGQTYTGGGEVSPVTAGAVPGGGGSAAITTFQSGATGGRGRAWFYCYQ
ncbi:minor tail protein [Mycobacterium phage ThulaThula]|uniref:Minor tail protein n=1 Tax=Mycobacterium phage ThulaThula TaxID=2599880 RepID=A0A5J6TDY9_9CAUD|nr:minor tail protein [Mycobacterium phage ThulaThula]QFG09051.1 minor tail protein [Mycobacterium phage ThulaThula]